MILCVRRDERDFRAEVTPRAVAFPALSVIAGSTALKREGNFARSAADKLRT